MADRVGAVQRAVERHRLAGDDTALQSQRAHAVMLELRDRVFRVQRIAPVPREGDGLGRRRHGGDEPAVLVAGRADAGTLLRGDDRMRVVKGKSVSELGTLGGSSKLK